MALRTVAELRASYYESFEDVRREFDASIAAHVESPIEELMVWGLLNCHGCFTYQSWYTTGASLLPGHDHDKDTFYIETDSSVMSWPRLIYLQPTVRVGEERYRLDVAIEQYSRHFPNARVFVAVECDGHDFHERTKEQAERDKRRDRDLQSIGWTIARFTGSEIVRDPVAAARQASDLTTTILQRRVDAENEIYQARLLKER